MRYARVQGNQVVEILKTIDGFTLEESFHPSIVSQCYESIDAEPSWYLHSDLTFSPEPEAVPEIVEEETIAAPQYPVIPPSKAKACEEAVAKATEGITDLGQLQAAAIAAINSVLAK